MKRSPVYIDRIDKDLIQTSNNSCVHVCWIQDAVYTIKIDDRIYENISNSIIFFNHNVNWSIIRHNGSPSAGYLLGISTELLNSPLLRKLHINDVRLFSKDEIPLFNLSPGIAKRTQSILEMIDELLGSELNHKDEAIMSLLNTFFVYCDGQCNIKSKISSNRSKSIVVYNFKRLVDKHLTELHDVNQYAELMNITPKYLNECVKEVLGFTAKAIIAEQLIMRSRQKLKFSDQSIKEISYNLGFSSPDYFSYFFKNQTGNSPSALRKRSVV